MAPSTEASSKSVNATRARKRVEADTSNSISLKRAKNGSAFTRCEECKKDVAVALISMHDCSLDAKIKMNLEAQVVETEKKVAEKPKVSKAKDQSAKKVKKVKDPNRPKRPQTAFFLFMDDYRKTYKEENPDCKKISMVAKGGGEKWKSMTDEEKKPYIEKAAELKEEYQKKALESQNDDAEGESNNDDQDSVEKETKVELVSDDE